MRAAWYERNGTAREVLNVGDMPVADPGPGEVRVRLHASGVNPSDVKGRAGATRKIGYPRVVPQSDGAGVIDALGVGVPHFVPGQRVWVFNGQWQRPFGTAAEYITLPAVQVVPLPARLSFAEGACLGIPAMTAHRCVFADGPVAGQTVLVTGGAGVVGHYAVQLAKWGGARVLATASSPEKAAHALSAGAEAVVDYRREDVVRRVRDLTDGAGVDRVVDVDFGGNLAVTHQVLRPNGTIAFYATSGDPDPKLPAWTMMRNNAVVRMVLVYDMPEAAKRQACDDLATWVADGGARFAVAGRFPLAEIAAAHELVEAGRKIGHVVVEML